MEPKEFTIPAELVDVKNRAEACKFINDAFSQDPELLIFQEHSLETVSTASFTNEKGEKSDLKIDPGWGSHGSIKIQEVSRAISRDVLNIQIKEGGVAECYLTKIGSRDNARKGVFKYPDSYIETFEMIDRIKSVLYSTKKILEIYSLYQTYFRNNNANGFGGDDGLDRLFLISSPRKYTFDPNLYTLSQVNRVITRDIPIMYWVTTVDGRTEFEIEF